MANQFKGLAQQAPQKEPLIQRQGPGTLEIESEVDNRLKKIVLNSLADFREFKIDK